LNGSNCVMIILNRGQTYPRNRLIVSWIYSGDGGTVTDPLACSVAAKVVLSPAALRSGSALPPTVRSSELDVLPMPLWLCRTRPKARSRANCTPLA
jgi:hypothetical protein